MERNGSSHDSPAKRLLDHLTRELFQTETSASRHCRREADRFREADAPPARALRAVAEHADRVLAELPAIVARHDLPVSTAGSALGSAFSQLRDRLFDATIASERSYRGTLLGCRHGLDLVRMLQHVAASEGNVELDDFFAAWLTTRQVLVRHMEEELLWFAQHPERALERARPLTLAVRPHSHAES